MYDDDKLQLIVSERMKEATGDVEAPASWRVSIPARAVRRRRHVRLMAASGSLAACGAAAVTAVALMGSGGASTAQVDQEAAASTGLTAFTSALNKQAASDHLPCLTSVPAAPPKAQRVLVNRQADVAGGFCPRVVARISHRVPRDAIRVHCDYGDVYLGKPAKGSQEIYFRLVKEQSVLDLTVSGSVQRSELIRLLNGSLGAAIVGLSPH